MASEPNSSESSSGELFESNIPLRTKLTLEIFQSIFQLCPAHNSLNSRINSLKISLNSQRLLPSSVLLKPSFGSASITSGTELPRKKKVLLLFRKGLKTPPCPGWFHKPYKKDGMFGACVALCTPLMTKANKECLVRNRDANTGPPYFIALCARPIGI